MDDGRDAEFKDRERAGLGEEFDRLANDLRRQGRAIAEETTKAITRLRLNPGEDYEDARASDLAQAEILSRMRLPSGPLVAEAEAYLEAGNPRQAKVRIDALRLQGTTGVIGLEQLDRAVEASLDEALPHRRQAKQLEAEATQAANRFVTTEATMRTRAARLLGQTKRAASASATAKLAAYAADPQGYIGTADVLGGPPASSGDA